MDPTLVPGTRFKFQFQICVYEHAILRIYINFFPTVFIYKFTFIIYIIFYNISIFLFVNKNHVFYIL